VRWLLYGDLGERHVVESLADALREAGHDVARVPSLVEATGAIDDDPGRERERERLIAAASPVDVLFSFRVDELTPALLSRVRDTGITTIGWLCDDPLYYEVTYRHVVSSYDLTLHTARADLLAYYEERHDVRGYTFPYWTDDRHYPYVYDPDSADVEIGFVGSFGGHARRIWRYDLLASLPFDVRFYGPVTRGLEDYAAMGLGVLSHDDVPQALRRFRVALNLAQTFDEGAVDRWTFPDLARFREYFFPSRLAAYASAGIPTLSLQRPGLPSPLASIVSVSNRADLVDAARELLSDRRRLVAASRAASDEFEACLSARSRVAMLETLLRGARNHPLEERASMWRGFGTKPVQPILERVHRPTAAPVSSARAVEPVERAEARTILLVGRGGRIERQLARGARELGHEVALVELDAAPELSAAGASGPRGFGPVEIDRGAATQLEVMLAWPDVAVYVDGCAPDEADAAGLRGAGVPLVCLRLVDPSFAVDTTSYLDRFDLVVTTSEEAAETYRAKGARDVVVIESSVEPLAETPGAAGVAIVGDGSAESIAASTRLDRVVEVREGASLAALAAGGPAAAAEARAALAAGVLPIAPAGWTAGLVADREILAYRNVAELLGIAGYYTRRPEETVPIRTTGSARVLAESRWSERWEEILDAIGPEPRPRSEPRVVVLGYYGMRNLGDELILDVVTKRLGGRAQVLGYGPGTVVADHGLAGAHVLDRDATEDIIRDADLLVIGSGGLLHDRELADGAALGDSFDDPGVAGIAGVLARNAALAATHGTPFVLLAVGAGPITSDPGRAVARFLVDRAASSSVRDQGSLDALRASGVTRDVLLAADPTLLIDPPDPEPGRAWLAEHGVTSPYVTVAMRRWKGAPEDPSERVAAVLDRLVEQFGVRVVFVPFQRHPKDRLDRAANRAVADRMRLAGAAVHFDDPSREVALGVIAQAQIGIAMRLHASVLANSFGVPTLGLSYDPKVATHYAETGRPEMAVPLDAPAARLSSLAADLLARRDEHASIMEEPIAAMRARAALAFESLHPLVRLDTARRRRSRAERDIAMESLRRELSGG
jgi:polysaccharide pyruvyl transferase WcaK-like protein